MNLCFGANFPTHEDAPYVAERLAAAGVNSVRCHHLDTSRWPSGIWNAADGKTIEPQALERLDYFINELAQRGIRVNLNLHVGRAHSQYLGLPPTNTDYDKITGIFTPALINAQKTVRPRPADPRQPIPRGAIRRRPGRRFRRDHQRGQLLHVGRRRDFADTPPLLWRDSPGQVQRLAEVSDTAPTRRSAPPGPQGHSRWVRTAAERHVHTVGQGQAEELEPGAT